MLWFDPLLHRFHSLALPLANLVLMNPAESEKLLLVVDQLLARFARQRIILHQENRLLGTHLLAIPAEDAAQHVYLKLLWCFFHVADLRRARRPWWGDADRFRRTDKLAQLA